MIADVCWSRSCRSLGDETCSDRLPCDVLALDGLLYVWLDGLLYVWLECGPLRSAPAPSELSHDWVTGGGRLLRHGAVLAGLSDVTRPAP